LDQITRFRMLPLISQEINEILVYSAH